MGLFLTMNKKNGCTKGSCQKVCCVNGVGPYLNIYKIIFFQWLHFRKFVHVHNVAHLFVNLIHRCLEDTCVSTMSQSVSIG